MTVPALVGCHTLERCSHQQRRRRDGCVRDVPGARRGGAGDRHRRAFDDDVHLDPRAVAEVGEHQGLVDRGRLSHQLVDDERLDERARPSLPSRAAGLTATAHLRQARSRGAWACVRSSPKRRRSSGAARWSGTARHLLHVEAARTAQPGIAPDLVRLSAQAGRSPRQVRGRSEDPPDRLAHALLLARPEVPVHVPESRARTCDRRPAGPASRCSPR